MKAQILFPALIGLAFAAPAPQPQSSFPSGANIVTPSTLSQYNVWTGAISFNTPTGKIFKNGQSPDITTLATFQLPPESQGRQCAFHFFLDNASVLSGTGLFDVFTSLAPATQSTTSWPPGNQRDQHVARLLAAKPGEATYVSGFPNIIASFPCPTGTHAVEFVPVGDVDDIEWAPPGTGPYVSFS